MSQNYVKWSVFIWVVAIVTAIIGVLFAIQIALMNNISQMKSDISAIKTDVNWIVRTLDKRDISLR